MSHHPELFWRDIALTLIESHFGRVSTSRVHQTWGDRIVVEAASARIPAGVVLKASAEQSVVIEAVALRHAHQMGVPTPSILVAGCDDRLPGNDYFVMTKATGLPWNSVDQTSAQQTRTLADIGSMFATLHRCAMRGYGPLTASGSGRFASWSTWLRGELQRSAQPLMQAGHLPQDFMHNAERVLRALAPAIDRVTPALLHGDLGDGEVFVDPLTGAVTAIVDWGNALCGDPLYDFARFVAGGPTDDERPARFWPGVKEAYARSIGCDVAVLESPAARFYEMHNAIGKANWSLCEAPDWIAPLCDKALRILSLAL
jgi:aminoglycoside phosphotransferase (APT) family kinase protein